jgi:hypothetical protein
MHIAKFDSFSGLWDLEQIWKELQSDSSGANLGTSFQVSKTIWENLSELDDPIFGCNPKLIILVAYAQGIPIAIAPFVKVIRQRKLGPLRINVSCIQFLSQLGEMFFRFSNDIVARKPSKELADAFIQWLYDNESFDLLHLAHIPENSVNFPDDFEPLLGEAFDTQIEIDRFGDFEKYKAHTYSTKFAKNMRTAQARIKRRSVNLTLDTVPMTDAILSEIRLFSHRKRRAFELHQDGYFFFLENICKILCSDVIVVKVHGIMVGYRIYLYFNGCKYLLDTFINRTFAPLELGSLLTEAALKQSFAMNLNFQSEGMWGTYHARKFGTRFVRMKKFVRSGNSLRGKAAMKAIQLRMKKILESNSKLSGSDDEMFG